MFSYASTGFGRKFEQTSLPGTKPYYQPNYACHGQLNHLIGSPLPGKGSKPKFMQILFCDPKDRTNNLINWSNQPYTGRKCDLILENIIQKVEILMQTKNKFHQLFKNFVNNYNDYEKKKVVIWASKMKQNEYALL